MSLTVYKGAVPNVQRAALVNMGDLAAYDCCKQFLLREVGMEDTALVHAAAAFAAGFVAAVMGTPADVIKTRLMNQPVGADGRLPRNLTFSVRISIEILKISHTQSKQSKSVD